MWGREKNMLMLIIWNFHYIVCKALEWFGSAFQLVEWEALNACGLAVLYYKRTHIDGPNVFEYSSELHHYRFLTHENFDVIMEGNKSY